MGLIFFTTFTAFPTFESATFDTPGSAEVRLHKKVQKIGQKMIVFQFHEPVRITNDRKNAPAAGVIIQMVVPWAHCLTVAGRKIKPNVFTPGNRKTAHRGADGSTV